MLFNFLGLLHHLTFNLGHHYKISFGTSITQHTHIHILSLSLFIKNIFHTFIFFISSLWNIRKSINAIISEFLSRSEILTTWVCCDFLINASTMRPSLHTTKRGKNYNFHRRQLARKTIEILPIPHENILNKSFCTAFYKYI